MRNERDRIGEIQDRLRRIETRLTKYMQERGFETQVQTPVWNNGKVIVPSLDVRLRDILTVIPESWARANDGDCPQMEVIHKDVLIIEFFLPVD